MKKSVLPLVVAATVLFPGMAASNDFSTVTRVQYVLDCMDAHSDMNVYESSNKCSCVIDKIAEEFNQVQYEDISTGFMYRNLPADRGASFRDDKQIRSGLKKFEQVHASAYQACHLK